jgi:hypothetical protein
VTEQQETFLLKHRLNCHNKKFRSGTPKKLNGGSPPPKQAPLWSGLGFGDV